MTTLAQNSIGVYLNIKGELGVHCGFEIDQNIPTGLEGLTFGKIVKKDISGKNVEYVTEISREDYDRLKARVPPGAI